MLKGFQKEISKPAENNELYKEAGVFSATIKSLKGLKNIGKTNTGKFFKRI